MKNPWKIAFFSLSGVFILVMAIMLSFINDIGPGNLKLILSLDKTDHDYLIPMHTLNTTDKRIVPIEVTPEGHRIYLTDITRSTDVQKLLKERLEKEGWTFTRQEGSSYFFDKGKEQTIVGTYIWNSDYVRISIPNNVVNIAG